MRISLSFLALCLCLGAGLRAEVGVLIPEGAPGPDPQKLSLDDMQVRVRINNGVARVNIRQIYQSHVRGVQEGEWTFVLPERATVSDFAVWDDVTRIPGVILERRRAEELYEQIRMQQIDPGLLRQGDGGVEEARRSRIFSARVVPIPGYGYKRVEIEYHERLPVDGLRSQFSLPLRPDAYEAQSAGRLSIELELTSPHALAEFAVSSEAYEANMREQGNNRVVLAYEGNDVLFSEDFTVTYGFDPAAANRLGVLTYRDPNPPEPSPAVMRPTQAGEEPGFFEASVVLGQQTAATDPAPRTLVLLFDNSLSMQWEKLDRSFAGLERVLRSLRPADRFNVLLFEDQVRPYSPAPVAAGPTEVAQALTFVRDSLIRGGTDLEAAVTEALGQFTGDRENYILLFTDGGATRGAISNARLGQSIADALADAPAAVRPKLYTFAVGDDANMPLVRMLAAHGVTEWVRSTEPVDFKLDNFIAKIGQQPVGNLNLSVTPSSGVGPIYALDAPWFAGSRATWVGRYEAPSREVTIAIAGAPGGALSRTAILPTRRTDNAHIPRSWARARVDALLDKIERDGEDRASIDEIIALARRYKFVTPYTSFLAAPRSLLRPRVIRPGDPVLRVRTDASIRSVTALFPFGEVKQLRYLDDGNVWQTRFLAPKDIADGEHAVRLVLRDNDGRVFRETKSFLVASKPPTVRVHLAKTQYRPGETIELNVSATRSTRTLTARLYGAAPVSLRWDPTSRANTGRLTVPEHLSPGRYDLLVTAEDFAHNIGTEEVALEVLP